jgi:hypothetical protein
MYIIDFFSAIWAWLTVWFVAKQKAERRKHFVDDMLDEKRRRQIPARLWYAAYNLRLKYYD